jgi:hypothetical protein
MNRRRQLAISFGVALLCMVVGSRSVTATVLSDATAALRPGEWVVLHTAGDDSGFSRELLYSGGQYITQFASKGLWDERHGWVEFLGAGHYAEGRYLRYREASNRWEIVERFPVEEPSERFSHGYEHHTLDPATGDIFRRRWRSGEFRRYDKQSGQWRELPTLPAPHTGYASAIEFFPELGGVVFVDSIAGVWLLELSSSRWTQLATADTVPLGGDNHQFAVYNRREKVVLFGGGNGNRRMYALTADRQIYELARQPVELGPKEGTVVVDPASGALLAFSFDGRFFSYDLRTNQWRYSRDDLSSHPADYLPSGGGFLPAISIPRYGVIMFIVAAGNDSRVLLYRHAPSSPEEADGATRPEATVLAGAGLATVPASGSVVALEEPSAVGGEVRASGDWAGRSADAWRAIRFDVAADVFDHALVDAAYDQISWDTERAISGAGSLRFRIGREHGPNFGNWRLHLKPDGSSLQPGEEIYVQWSQYTPRSMLRQTFDGPIYTGFKSSIVSTYARSNPGYEVVIQNSYQGGLVRGYFLGQSTDDVNEPIRTACSPSDFVSQPAVDRGRKPLSGRSPDGDRWTACEQDRARYGGLYSAMTAGGFRGAAGPDPLTGGFTYPEDGWYTVLQRIRISDRGPSDASNEWQVWAAKDGGEYVELWNVHFAFGGHAQEVNALWLLPYMTRVGPDAAREDTFTLYDEVITSPVFIPAPRAAARGADRSARALDSAVAAPGASPAGTAAVAGSAPKVNTTRPTPPAKSTAPASTRAATGSAPAVKTSDAGAAGGAAGASTRIRLAVSADAVATGETVRIEWHSDDATDCTALGDWSGPRGTTGTERSRPLKRNSVFALECNGPRGPARATATVGIRSSADVLPSPRGADDPVSEP